MLFHCRDEPSLSVRLMPLAEIIYYLCQSLVYFFISSHIACNLACTAVSTVQHYSLYFRRGIGASAAQKGRAAEIRSFVDFKEPLKKKLNQIVHSGDKNPHRYGENPYADQGNQYDPAAQVVIEKAERKVKKTH